MFSILDRELQSEDLYTVEDLKKKLLNAPINPKPICNTVDFTYDWKSFITPYLADPQLSNHSKFHAFLITYENDKAILR